jgi:hypothetical protein
MPCRSKNVVPDPLVNPRNPPHRHQAQPAANPARSYHRVVTVAARPSSRSTRRTSKKKNATVMLVFGTHNPMSRMVAPYANPTRSAEHRDAAAYIPAYGYAERLIGTIRRECIDHLIVFGEAHLRRILREYASYYNGLRTHRALNQDAPIHRTVQTIGTITSRPIFGGLHHQYRRI